MFYNIIADLIIKSYPNKEKTNNCRLQLAPIQVREDYAKEWNERLTDFVVLSKDGELLRPTLYRVGGLNFPNLCEDKYFMLLKYVEAYYPESIMRHSTSKSPKHLDGRWCILDADGNERIEFESFRCPYLVKDSCLYSLNGKYYNIETGEHYGSSSTSIESKEFIFLDNRYDSDKSKRGVMKINKKDGSWELFQ